MKTLKTLFIALCVFSFPSFSQVVDQETIMEELENGNVEKAEKHLVEFLTGEDRITEEDSLFIYRNLGIIYSLDSKKRVLAKEYFINMLKIDPAAHLVDTYASNATLAFFRQTKKLFQVEYGGSSLLPKMLVMDVLSTEVREKDRSSMARQFIEELQGRTRIFSPMEREEMKEGLKLFKRSQKDCKTKSCFLELATLLQADKLVLLELNKIANTYTLTLKYIDVATKEPESILKKTSQGTLDPLILEGIGLLAEELEKANAAWLQLSVEPKNSYLELDGEPTGSSEKLAVNPGKHTICASAPGHKSSCKHLTVQKNDALTHTLILKAIEGKLPSEKTNLAKPNVVKTKEPVPAEEGSAASWWITGAMAVVVVGLAVLFNFTD